MNNRAWANSTNDIIAFRLVQNIGMFGTLTHSLLLCKFCFEQGVRPIFSYENGLYGEGDWFKRFFSHKFELLPTEQPQRVEVIHNRFDINAVARGCKEIEIHNEFKTLLEGALLFNFFIAIKPDIKTYLENTTQKAQVTTDTIGIHYRGTDKFLHESQSIAYEQVLEQAERRINGQKKVFLATDDQVFFELACSRIPNARLSYLRQPTGRVHHEEPASFLKGLQALTDAWLLSRCGILIKTPSLLSAWSRLFNPRLPVVLIGRPKLRPYGDEDGSVVGGYFPENLLHEPGDRMTEFVPCPS
jgi:hypothetical protein